MRDDETTLAQLRAQVAQFAQERDWEQFHTPKDLAVGLTIEAAELLELFLWKTSEEVDAQAHEAEPRQRMAEELADVLIFCLNFANRLDLDLSSAISAKLELNAAKYPVDQARGSSRKSTEL